jgi:hypothetical protein
MHSLGRKPIVPGYLVFWEVSRISDKTGYSLVMVLVAKQD